LQPTATSEAQLPEYNTIEVSYEPTKQVEKVAVPASVAVHLNQTSLFVVPQLRKVPVHSASVTAGRAVTVAVVVLKFVATPVTSVGAVTHSSWANTTGHAQSTVAAQAVKKVFLMVRCILVNVNGDFNASKCGDGGKPGTVDLSPTRSEINANLTHL
jgi:uncharacterized membrane protein (DUF485 family)